MRRGACATRPRKCSPTNKRKQGEAVNETKNIVDLAVREAEALAAETRKSVKEHFDRRMKLAEDKIARAEQDAVREVRSVAVDAAVAAAQNSIAKDLDAPRYKEARVGEHRRAQIQAELIAAGTSARAPATCSSRRRRPGRRPWCRRWTLPPVRRSQGAASNSRSRSPSLRSRCPGSSRRRRSRSRP